MKFFVEEVKKSIKNHDVTIVAATKYFDSNEMKKLFEEGITHFCENRVSALLQKQIDLQDFPITWHFIGTLQTKKVKKIINNIDYLHSLNTIKLAHEINKRRIKPLKCFLQVNISGEESKHGFEPSEIPNVLKEIQHLPNVEIVGLMGMAMHTDDQTIIHKEFQRLNELQENLKKTHPKQVKELSIGMSNDYLIALEHNATFIRLGSVLFKREV